MAAVTRIEVDSHVGHESPTPNPFHQYPYATGSSDVITNDKKTVRIGDTTTCGDPAIGGSTKVFINDLEVHRKGDPTGGHDSWVPNVSASGSDNVFIGDDEAVYTTYNEALVTGTSTLSEEKEEFKLTEVAKIRNREIARVKEVMANADTEAKRQALGEDDYGDSWVYYKILQRITFNGTGWASQTCPWVDDGTTVDQVLTSLYAKIEILEGDDYVAHLSDAGEFPRYWYGLPADITTQIESSITKDVQFGGRVVSQQLDFTKFHASVLENRYIKTGQTIKAWQWYYPGQTPPEGKVLIYRTNIVNDYKALLKTSLTHGHANKYINLGELKQSIDAWTPPLNSWLTTLNSVDTYKIPIYIIDYQFEVNTLTWVNDYVNGQVLPADFNNRTTTSGFALPERYIVIVLSAGTKNFEPLDRLKTTLHESAHFLHKASWGSPDDPLAGVRGKKIPGSGTGIKLLSQRTMSRLYDLWNGYQGGMNHRSTVDPTINSKFRGIIEPQHLMDWFQLPSEPDVCLNGKLQPLTGGLEPYQLRGIWSSPGSCNAAGGTMQLGGRTWALERQVRKAIFYKGKQLPGRPAPYPVGTGSYRGMSNKTWPDREYFEFKALIINPNFPILIQLGMLKLYHGLSSWVREDEFMARVYAAMATNSCMGFKKDLASLINDYNRIINGVPETIPEREAELVDTEMREIMKLNKRVL